MNITSGKGLPIITSDSGFSCTVVADSISAWSRQRLTTVALRYPRFIHSELMTHRALSRNASSSRAIPVKTMLKQVWNDPAMPIHWGANRKGMQAKDELTGWRGRLARTVWRLAGKVACVFAWSFEKLGLHKQVANRILEPWQWMGTLVTATEWENFFRLRRHKDAQPEFRLLADLIWGAMETSKPVPKTLGEWHLPFSFVNDQSDNRINEEHDALIVSAARAAWVSYKMPDGSEADFNKCLSTFLKLVGDPLHASPLEHQARVGRIGPESLERNFQGGWHQHRALREEQDLKVEERHITAVSPRRAK